MISFLDLPVARERLEAFASAIQAHIAVEEGRLLPLYEARCIPPPGAGIELFLVEHRRVEGYIAEFRATLSALLEVGNPARRRVVALLDRQWHLKGLLEHHDLRERNALYPELDKVTSPEERARILGRMLA